MPVSATQLEAIVDEALDRFYTRRIAKLSTLKLRDALRRKNPYLFRAIGTQDAAKLVEQLLAAYISSSDEGIFGDAFFEPVALAVSGGDVAPSEGIDVAIHGAKSYKAIAIKSGPSVFNSQSRKKQEQDFMRLKSRLHKVQKHFDAVVGYAYGTKLSREDSKCIFREVAGQAFWQELTGDAKFYIRLLESMKDKPLKHKERYALEWEKAKNRFTLEFMGEFCKKSGEIDWVKLLEFNSGTLGRK